MRSSLSIGVCVCSLALLLMGQDGGCGGTADGGDPGIGGDNRGTGGTPSGGGGASGEPLGPVMSVCEWAAVLADGQVIGWGSNHRGSLGANSEDFADGLARVPLDGRAKVVACAGRTTCVLMEDGTVQCMGANGYGQLGNGTSNVDGDLAPVEGVDSALQLFTVQSSGGIAFCVVTEAGELKCWGFNTGFGPGSEEREYTRPFTVAAPGPVAEGVMVGFYNGGSVCVRLRAGGVYCSSTRGYWPWDTDNGYDFVLVPGTEDAVAVRGGAHNICVILTGGRVLCQGYNTYGNLGAGHEDEAVERAMVEGLTDAVDVYPGYGAPADPWPSAVRADGTMWVWGGGDGRISHMALPDDLKPSASKIAKLVGGGRFTHFLLEDGTLVRDPKPRSCFSVPELVCEPGERLTLDDPLGTNLGFRSDVDPGCVLSEVCETLRE